MESNQPRSSAPYDYIVYTIGINSACICASKSIPHAELADRLNRSYPLENGKQWTLDITKPNPSTGEANGCPCVLHSDTHCHYHLTVKE